MTEFTEIEGLASERLCGWARQTGTAVAERCYWGSHEGHCWPLKWVSPKWIISPRFFWFSFKCDPWFQLLSRQLSAMCKKALTSPMNPCLMGCTDATFLEQFLLCVNVQTDFKVPDVSLGMFHPILETMRGSR